MSSAIGVADGHRQFSMSLTMRNFSIPIPRPISWAASAFMARLRQIDEATALGYSDHNTAAQPVQGTMTGPQRQPFQQMPVPWTFLTSGYFIGFLIYVRFVTPGCQPSLTQRLWQALVSNRIQDIVSPPRLGPRQHRNRDDGTPYGLRSRARHVWSRLFPIDLSSTLSRTIIRLPSSYLLLKSLFIWTTIVLQAFRLFPTTHVGWLHDIDTQVDRWETGEVCWSTFIAVCAALCINYITSGLEGLGRDAPPFNLVRTSHRPHNRQLVNFEVRIRIPASLVLFPKYQRRPKGRFCVAPYQALPDSNHSPAASGQWDVSPSPTLF